MPGAGALLFDEPSGGGGHVGGFLAFISGASLRGSSYLNIGFQLRHRTCDLYNHETGGADRVGELQLEFLSGRVHQRCLSLHTYICEL